MFNKNGIFFIYKKFVGAETGDKQSRGNTRVDRTPAFKEPLQSSFKGKRWFSMSKEPGFIL